MLVQALTCWCDLCGLRLWFHQGPTDERVPPQQSMQGERRHCRLQWSRILPVARWCCSLYLRSWFPE